MKNITFSSWIPPFAESIKYVFIVFLAIIFLVELILSLRMQITADGGLLYYATYLINEHDFIPYRDIFEFNMPGTYLFYMSIAQLLGYSNLAYYIANSIWIIIKLIFTWFFMKHISKTAALAACLFFGLIYLQIKPHYMALERDAILVLPIAMRKNP